MDHQVNCWVFKSGGVGMAKSLMCENFIEEANYFEQIAAFDLSGDWTGDVSGQESLLLFFKCSTFFMHNNIISVTFKCFCFRKAFFFAFLDIELRRLNNFVLHMS